MVRKFMFLKTLKYDLKNALKSITNYSVFSSTQLYFWVELTRLPRRNIGQSDVQPVTTGRRLNLARVSKLNYENRFATFNQLTFANPQSISATFLLLKCNVEGYFFPAANILNFVLATNLFVRIWLQKNNLPATSLI